MQHSLQMEPEHSHQITFCRNRNDAKARTSRVCGRPGRYRSSAVSKREREREYVRRGSHRETPREERVMSKMGRRREEVMVSCAPFGCEVPTLVVAGPATPLGVALRSTDSPSVAGARRESEPKKSNMTTPNREPFLSAKYDSVLPFIPGDELLPCASCDGVTAIPAYPLT